MSIDATAAAPARDATVAAERNPSPFLLALFRLLDERAVRYCVLHSWQRLPEELPSDLDIAVHPQDRTTFFAMLKDVAAAGFRPVQSLNYSLDAFYFVFVWHEGTRLRCVALDTIFDHWRSGLCSLRGGEMVAGRSRQGVFWAASPEVEFAYLLAKRAWKGGASPTQARRFQELAEHLSRARAEELAGRVFLPTVKELVVDACLAGSLSEVLPRLKPQLSRTALARHPLALARFLLAESARVMRRWWKPTGLFLAVLGPDGVGKSTLVENVCCELGPCFRRVRVYHWRPGLVAQSKSAPVTAPHQKPARGIVASCLILLGVLLDYWLSYALVVRPFLARSGLVLFDRYFPDLLVDPLRYRYGGPKWFARALGSLLPKPDLPYLVLDAEDQSILARKHELPPEELRRQLGQYRSLTRASHEAVLVDSDNGVEPTLAKVTHLVVQHLAERFEMRSANVSSPSS